MKWAQGQMIPASTIQSSTNKFEKLCTLLKHVLVLGKKTKYKTLTLTYVVKVIWSLLERHVYETETTILAIVDILLIVLENQTKTKQEAVRLTDNHICCISWNKFRGR